MPAALFDSWLINALGSTSSGGAPNCDLLSDTIKGSLHNGYVPNKATHDFADDRTSEIAATGGYSTGGQTLANKTLALTSSVIKFDADDIVYATATITADEVVVYDDTPATAATKPLIWYHDNGSPVVSTGGEWRCAFHANGIASITISAAA